MASTVLKQFDAKLARVELTQNGSLLLLTFKDGSRIGMWADGRPMEVAHPSTKVN